MIHHRLAVLVVTLTIIAAPDLALGQASTASDNKNPSFFGQLDQFGKKIFSGIMPAKSEDESQKSSPPDNGKFTRGPMQDDFGSSRTGSVLDAANKKAAIGKTVKAEASMPKAAVAMKAERPQTPLPTTPQNKPSTSTQYQPNIEQSPVDIRPLHERLSGLSQSPYSAQTKPANSANPPATPKPPIADKKESPKPAQNTLLPTHQSPQPSPHSPQPSHQPPQPAPKAAPDGNVVIESESPDHPEADVLFERRSPMLSVRTMGPRHIIVDKESTYTVFIDNLGKAEAAEVAVAIELPAWAEVLGVRPSQGETQLVNSPDGRKKIAWQVGSLAAAGSQKIALRIVSRESRAIDLGVNWAFKPASSQTVIEVQEPKLEMQLIGPREAAFGKMQKYQLEIANNGNGPAEAVAITLMPVSAAAGLPNTHNLGVFPPGKKTSLEIALTPRQKDGLAVRVDLHNEGKICARLDEKILVRKAELEIIADGPNMQYVGTVATYRIRLRNTGNADAKNIKVAAKIPAQAKFLAADADGKLLETDARAVWTLESISPQSEKILELKCELVQAGFNRIDVETTADDNIQVSTAAATNVEAMADLALEVSDPTGPVPVGKDAVYQIRIRNRGSKQAEGVEAVAYFSQGIEPTAVSGAEHALGPGQVRFRGIETIPAGKEVILKITARADAPGNHMFRAEVHSKPLDIKLVSEETTHFFNGTLIADRPAVNQQGMNLPTLPGSAPQEAAKPIVLQESRTADARNLWDSGPAPVVTPQPAADGQQTPTVAPRYHLQTR